MPANTLLPADSPAAGAVATLAHPLPCQPVPDGPDESWLDHLADSLARNGWADLDGRRQLGADLLTALQKEVTVLDQRGAMRRAGIGRGADHFRDGSVRRDRIAWLEGKSAPQQALFAFFEMLREGLNRRLFLGLRRFECHYATYQPGGFYRRHVDSFRGRASRVVSLVLYLNDDWQAGEGGALRVYHPDDEDKVLASVLPETGRMAVFMSEEVPHEVMPATRTRCSLACWFRQDEVPLPL
ncbi:MAG: 2OG-Fe(II) oxygenase [Pseudomonadota bacterium]|nr:2OG-Fe(II) oxygenase [Pseudomonadota bacterium]